MTKLNNKQKDRRIRQNKKSTVSFEDQNENPEYRSGDTAIVKFDPLQRYLAEISKHKLLTR